MGMRLHAAHVNVRSLLANFNPFRHHVVSNDYDIIGVTETWLSSRVDDDLVSIADYSFSGKIVLTDAEAVLGCM